MVAGVISAVLAGGYGSAPGGAGLVIEATATSQTGFGSSHSVTIPANNSGEALLIFGNTQNGVAANLPTDWTQRFQEVTISGRRLICFSRIAGAGGVSSPVTITTASDCFGAWVAYRISGNASGIESASVSGNSTNADPPNLAPSWGSAATLWIVAVATSDAPSAAPTNYTNSIPVANSGGVHVMTASRLLTASSENPGTFTSTNQEWPAATVAVQPA